MGRPGEMRDHPLGAGSRRPFDLRARLLADRRQNVVQRGVLRVDREPSVAIVDLRGLRRLLLR